MTGQSSYVNESASSGLTGASKLKTRAIFVTELDTEDLSVVARVANHLGYSVEDCQDFSTLCKKIAKTRDENLVVLISSESGDGSKAVEKIASCNPSAKVMISVAEKPERASKSAKEVYIQSPIEAMGLYDALVGFAGHDSTSNGDVRKLLMGELDTLGFVEDEFKNCGVEQLRDLLRGAKWLHRTYQADSKPVQQKDYDSDIGNAPAIDSKHFDGNNRLASFTEVDKKVLRALLASSGKVSSLALSRKLDIPLTTIQRRRKRLESEFLEVAYTLRLDKLGWRKADLLVATYKGTTSAVGKDLLSNNAITRVCRSIGEHTIDLHAEVVFKNNTELLNTIEWIKSLDGVKDVIWTEPVQEVGKNSGISFEIIDKHT